MNGSVSCDRPFKINVNQTNILWLKRWRRRAPARSLASRMSAARAHARFMILEAHYPPYLSKHTHRRALARVPRPTDGILRKVNLWRVLWGCADNPLWWICSHSQSVILKAFWMRGRPPPIWNRNFINHLRWQTALRRASHWMGGNLLRMTIDAGLRVRLTGVAGTHFKLTLLPVKKLCHLAQTFILQQFLVEEGRDYCRRRCQTLEIKEWIAIGNFFFWLRPSIVLDESLNLLHLPLVEMRIFLHYLSSFFAEIVSFQAAFPPFFFLRKLQHRVSSRFNSLWARSEVLRTKLVILQWHWTLSKWSKKKSGRRQGGSR